MTPLRHLAAWSIAALALPACASPAARPETGSLAETPTPEAPSTPTSPSASTSPATSSTATLPDDGFVRHAGSPDPLACQKDSDCTSGQTFDASGCCGTFRDMAATPQTQAYMDFTHAWRTANCKDHACPSPPVPSEPPKCLFDVRCVEKRCANTCP